MENFNQFKELVRGFSEDQFDIKVDRPLTYETNVRHLISDSLEMIELVQELEDHYDVTVTNLHTIETLGQLYEAVKNGHMQ